jgi:5'-deoxynucleotidase YfbR-like HD superfamily hydrolase
MKQELQFYSRGSEVTRYHTLRTLQTETVGHHSHGVAMLCVLLRPDASAALLKAALVHDLAEHLTGDMPAPAKRLYGIGDQVNAVEAALLEGSGLSMPSLTPEEARTLKLADNLQGLLFCARELQLGNEGAREVFDRYVEYINLPTLTAAEAELFYAIKEMGK